MGQDRMYGQSNKANDKKKVKKGKNQKVLIISSMAIDI